MMPLSRYRGTQGVRKNTASGPGRVPGKGFYVNTMFNGSIPEFL